MNIEDTHTFLDGSPRVTRLTISELYKEPGNGSSLRNAARMQRSLQIQSGGRGAFPMSLASDVYLGHTSEWWGLPQDAQEDKTQGQCQST